MLGIRSAAKVCGQGADGDDGREPGIRVATGIPGSESLGSRDPSHWDPCIRVTRVWQPGREGSRQEAGWLGGAVVSGTVVTTVTVVMAADISSTAERRETDSIRDGCSHPAWISWSWVQSSVNIVQSPRGFDGRKLLVLRRRCSMQQESRNLHTAYHARVLQSSENSI